MEQVRLAVCALDPITVAGLKNCFEPRHGMTLIQDPRLEEVDVVVAVFDRLTTNAVGVLRSVAGEVGKPIVLVVNEIREDELLSAVECRVLAILPRMAATDGRLVDAVREVAAGGAVIPPNLLGQLLEQAERLDREVLAPHGLTASRLSAREIDVLRLMANGMGTNEIARSLRYSERTVKNIIYGLTNRLNLRNRTHAVAFAMRAGVI